MRQPEDDIFTPHAELLPEDILQPHVEDLISGNWRSLPWHGWPLLSRMAKALFPGTITVVCGQPGSTKSMMLLSACHRWHTHGIKTAAMVLEGDPRFHLTRLLAILSGTWNVLDDDWCRDNADHLRRMYQAYRATIDDYAPVLSAAPVGQLRYERVIDWMKTKLDDGVEVLCIDPITAVATSGTRFEEDLRFITTSTELLIQYGARLILVTHPKGGVKQKDPQMDMLAGGQAFNRHTQTVLWLSATKERAAIITGDSGAANLCVNRVVNILKNTNGKGERQRIGYYLDSSVTFHEQGIITKLGKDWEA